MTHGGMHKMISQHHRFFPRLPPSLHGREDILHAMNKEKAASCCCVFAAFTLFITKRQHPLVWPQKLHGGAGLMESPLDKCGMQNVHKLHLCFTSNTCMLPLALLHLLCVLNVQHTTNNHTLRCVYGRVCCTS